MNAIVAQVPDQMLSQATIRVVSEKLGIAEISELMGLAPTRYVDRRMVPGLPSGTSRARWFYDSDLPNESSVEQHLQHLLALLKLRRPRLDELKDKVQIDIWCTCTARGGTVAITLEADLARRAAELGVAFTFSVHAQ